MAFNYTTPGVYIEEIPTLPRSVAQVATAIPAFIGYTEKALDLSGGDLTNKPKRISSLLDYETYFGGAQPEENFKVTYDETTDSAHVTIAETLAIEITPKSSLHNMYYAMQAYFTNGGGPCYIVSVGPYKALGDDLDLDELRDGLAATASEDEPTLLVFPEAQSLDADDFHSLMEEALAQCGKLQDRFTIMDIHEKGSTTTVLEDAADEFRDGVTPTDSKNLEYGAAYFPNLLANIGYAYTEANVSIVHTVNKAAEAGADLALNGKKLDAIPAVSTAAYNKLKKAVDSFPVILPPSPFVAGVYCTVDGSRGVWKAPANVALANVIGPTFKVSHEQQGNLNVDPVSGKSINVIRTFTGRGTLVWGARTLAGNDNEWRYINVRRLFIMVEESCKLATEPFVFDPNDANTWVKVQSMCENFLTTLWRQGALQGAKPEHAFYVSVGLGKTMSALDILEGRLIVEIGLAAVRPAEFIILRFMHKLAES
jgi:phage tail sheath protein FI